MPKQLRAKRSFHITLSFEIPVSRKFAREVLEEMLANGASHYSNDQAHMTGEHPDLEPDPELLHTTIRR